MPGRGLTLRATATPISPGGSGARQPPERGRPHVAEDGAASDGCDWREEAPVLRKLPMPGHVHAAMDRVKPPNKDAIPHCRRRHAERA